MSKSQEFTTKLKRLWYSFKEIFFEEKEKPKPISSLAARVLKSKKEIEKIQPYLDRLLRALSSEGVTNIALTGTYGSGKSTVIKTFQDLHKAEDPNNDFEYLNISLASFKDEIIEEQENPNKIKRIRTPQSYENFERLLEVSILQQMVYHVKPSRIPDSRFKRIINLTDKKLTLKALLFVIWLISTFFMWEFEILKKLNPYSWTFSFKDFDFVSFLITAIFLSGLTGIIFKLIRIFGNSRISKINIKGELELGEDVDKSILNQHLDEIIYFFQKTKFNVIVIEDLDRFRDTEIFTKLREINLLLNNSELIKRKIVFVYAIRDDMFQGHERIKFFDLIIPIIPFINPSNANDKFSELLKEAKLDGNFSQSFIDNVVTFIDDIDMRLLTNILQEYLVYDESLKHKLKPDNLLAIIIYKNIYPRDFAKLHSNEGDLYNFISKKDEYIQDLIAEFDDEIKEHQSVISKIEKEHVESEKELREIYALNLLSQLSNPLSITLNQSDVSIKNLTNDENFKTLLAQERIRYKRFDERYRSVSNDVKEIPFSDIERKVNQKYSYEKRLEFISNRKNNKINYLKEQIESLKERKKDVQRWDLKQIFEKQDVINYLGAFTDSILMRSLLVNGYINENYLDYISLFHEVNITKGDYTFIRNVKSSSISDFDYRLEKLENVVRRINEGHFEKIAILNHQIVEFILKNKYRYPDKYDSLKKLLKSENKRVIEFIDSYKKSEELDKAILFKELTLLWQDFWEFIITKSKFSEKKTNEYFQLIIVHASLSDINKLSNLESFKRHFSDLSNLGELVDSKDHTEKLKSIIASFKTKFSNIAELNYKNEFLYDYVLNNDNYESNTSNLLSIVIDEGGSEEAFMNANYTTLRNLENKLPLAYIEKHIEKYITDVFLTLGNTEETEESLVSLLNNSNLTIPTRKLIIKSTVPVFQTLSKVDDVEIKEEVLKQFAIIPSWKNIMDYFNTYEKDNLDSILIDYLNDEDVYKELGKSDLSSLEEEDDETKKKLALAIIYCDDLSLESHTSLRRCHFKSWKGLSIENLSEDKVESMIETKFINLSVNYYDLVKIHFVDLNIKLIENDFYTFIKAHGEYEMDEEDHLALLQSSRLIDSQKKQFLDTLDHNQIVENPTLASLAIKVYVNEKINGLPYGFIYGLFNKVNSDEYRIRLFNLNIDGLVKKEAKSLVGQLGHPYKRFVNPRKQTKVIKNELNFEFTENLKKLGLITSNRETKGMLKVVASR